MVHQRMDLILVYDNSQNFVSTAYFTYSRRDNRRYINNCNFDAKIQEIYLYDFLKKNKANASEKKNICWVVTLTVVSETE